jgi:DNA repair exonuclease SbcCD ATPase subunit
VTLETVLDQVHQSQQEHSEAIAEAVNFQQEIIQRLEDLSHSLDRVANTQQELNEVGTIRTELEEMKRILAPLRASTDTLSRIPFISRYF